MRDDDWSNDLFDMMDKIFGRTRIRSGLPGPSYPSKEERMIDEDYIYYTFELRELNKEDIDIKPYPNTLEVTLTRDGVTRDHNIKLPYTILPKGTKVTFINGILDITVKIDKEKSERIEIED